MFYTFADFKLLKRFGQIIMKNNKYFLYFIIIIKAFITRSNMSRHHTAPYKIKKHTNTMQKYSTQLTEWHKNS
jgi:predicted GH43/DUF377 family glycosyl hydrolase